MKNCQSRVRTRPGTSKRINPRFGYHASESHHPSLDGKSTHLENLERQQKCMRKRIFEHSNSSISTIEKSSIIKAMFQRRVCALNSQLSSWLKGPKFGDVGEGKEQFLRGISYARRRWLVSAA